MSYVFIALTIMLTVYGQLILKWQVGVHGHLLAAPLQPLNLVQLLLKPWVISAFAAAFVAITVRAVPPQGYGQCCRK